MGNELFIIFSPYEMAEVEEVAERILEAEPEVLIDESGAYVFILRDYIKNAKELFQELQTQVEWRNESVKLYGRSIPQPRLVYGYGDEGIVHKYSGLTLDLKEWHPEVAAIRNHLEETFGLEFNAALLNYYRTGGDYIGFHSDKEVTPPLNAVATVSLGTARDFVYKRKSGGDPIKTKLYNGDVVIMLGATQKLFTHSIPKRANTGPRISITYRLLAA